MTDDRRQKTVGLEGEKARREAVSEVEGLIARSSKVKARKVIAESS
jgi:hypothetical protein